MPEFYITSRHGDCGSNVMFHNKNGAGYGTDLNDLHLFTLKEAQEQLNWDINSLPLLKSEVDKFSISAVDCQYLNEDKNGNDPNDQYVIQVKRCWNGNDIAFAANNGKTYDYSKAEIFDFLTGDRFSMLDENYMLWSKSYLDTICRKTFQRENINTKKMITGAGVIYKKPRKKKPSSGKVRWNCPSCGKISWQYNPYDFDGCLDIMCDSH